MRFFVFCTSCFHIKYACVAYTFTTVLILVVAAMATATILYKGVHMVDLGYSLETEVSGLIFHKFVETGLRSEYILIKNQQLIYSSSHA